jgi:hypothetical protein
MIKKIVLLMMLFHITCLGTQGSAFAESPGLGKKLKDNQQGLQEAIAFISGISHIEYQTKVNDKERWDYYALLRHDKCMLRISDEISMIDLVSGKTLGTTYTEATIDLADIATVSIEDAENELIDNQDYLRARMSCKATTKCIKYGKVVGNETGSDKMLDSFSFIVRKTTSKTDLVKVFSKAINSCRHN